MSTAAKQCFKKYALIIFANNLFLRHFSTKVHAIVLNSMKLIKLKQHQTQLIRPYTCTEIKKNNITPFKNENERLYALNTWAGASCRQLILHHDKAATKGLSGGSRGRQFGATAPQTTVAPRYNGDPLIKMCLFRAYRSRNGGKNTLY